MDEKSWKKKLTKEQYYILREKGTEPPGSGKLLHNKEKGTYLCAACETPIFKSQDKFDSGSGWPSFSDAINKNITTKTDASLGMIRTEVICRKCSSHLGHLFKDGPLPSKKRYCLNSVSLKFKKVNPENNKLLKTIFL